MDALGSLLSTQEARVALGYRHERLLVPIYTVRFCRMRQAYDRPTTRIVSCKSNLQLAYDCRVWQKKCRSILKHVLKRCDNRRRNRKKMTYFVTNFY